MTAPKKISFWKKKTGCLRKNRMLVEKQDYEIYAATLKERNRIAREIHDNVGHLLSRSILITGAAKALNASDTLSPVLDNLDHSLNQAMTSIRSSVHDLHDESLNLKEAAESLRFYILSRNSAL